MDQSHPKSEANGHLKEVPAELVDNSIKCTFCSAVNPRIVTRVMEISPVVAAFIFGCGKCRRIISISALMIPPQEEDEGVIVKPF